MYGSSAFDLSASAESFVHGDRYLERASLPMGRTTSTLGKGALFGGTASLLDGRAPSLVIRATLPIGRGSFLEDKHFLLLAGRLLLLVKHLVLLEEHLFSSAEHLFLVKERRFSSAEDLFPLTD
jgi:hypothetical protein